MKGFRLFSRLKVLFGFLGPAFIVSVAYIDPGNFATNISGGSKFNYSLLWVILASNIMAIFIQTLSAKLGIATGQNLPNMCGRIFKRGLNWFFWAVAELAAMATDLAEFLGGTLGLYLLFNIPMVYAGLITAAVTFGIVYLAKYGQRVLEAVITLFVAVICIAYAAELFLAQPDWQQVALHTILPSINGEGALLIAVGMLGATVMPHVIYLHSELVQHRNDKLNAFNKKRHLKMEKLDILIAMNIAFVVNAAMVIVSAALFFKNGIAVETIEQAHKSLSPIAGNFSAAAFGVALLASGLSSSAVGTMAGQTILQGFVGLKMSDNATRLITMIPAMLIIILGSNPMQALILSQVVLSFVLPMAIIPLLLITAKKSLMGKLANRPFTNIIGFIICSLIVILNMTLLYFVFTGRA